MLRIFNFPTRKHRQDLWMIQESIWLEIHINTELINGSLHSPLVDRQVMIELNIEECYPVRMQIDDEIETFTPQAFKVLITTSGIGGRLGDFTKYTNKSLVAIGEKPAISKIIESYPTDTTFVVTLGHYGALVQDFLTIAYPNLSFEFVNVENFDQTGSSLGLSMLHARENLQCPFIFHASDTLLPGQVIPAPSVDWIGGSKGEDSSQYRSFDSVDGRVIKIHSKGMDKFDFLHIGVLGISSYVQFWNALENLYTKNRFNKDLNDLLVVGELVNQGFEFRVKEFKKWIDVGSVKGLLLAREGEINPLASLDKLDESIFRIENHIIKFFANKEVCSRRITRAEILAPHVPSIDAYSDNFYRYEYVQGTVLSNCLNPTVFNELLTWAEESFWRYTDGSIGDADFKEICKEFYFDKTLQRISEFFSKSGYTDSANIINGEKIPNIFDLIQLLKNTRLFEGLPVKIHGDFILDNLIFGESGFTALDWRQDFGGQLEIGDIYYDLAKLNHSLTMNHDLIKKNGFTIEIKNGVVRAEILRRSTFIECDNILRQFIESRKLDYERISILTAVIWLNMSALHPYPLDLFLFNYGKYSLWKSLQSS